MSDESAVMENPVAETETKTRKVTPLSDVQKQAATLRRDATLLEKYGQTDKARELFAQADALAPQRAPQAARVDPLKVLSQDEQNWLIKYFGTTPKGFAKIAALVSAKRLGEVFQEQGQ